MLGEYLRSKIEEEQTQVAGDGLTYCDNLTMTYCDNGMTYCDNGMTYCDNVTMTYCDGENDDGEVVMLMEITTQIGNKSLIKIMAQCS